MTNPIVTIEMENGDIMKAELYPEVAPNTVNNFVSLVKKGYYDGLIFHRVINGFMIQGGCPDGTGMGGPGYTIKGEFAQNGFANNLAHTEGVLSMARAMHPDSAGSQFFIMHKAAPHLDGAYAAFGKIIEGMDIVTTNLSEWLEHIMAAIVLIAIVIAIASLWEPFKEFLHTRTESGSFLEYMASVFDIVIGIEFFKLLCKPRKDTMLEVLMFVIARHMIIEHTTAVENLLSIIAISILIIVDRYFLKSKTLN